MTRKQRILQNFLVGLFGTTSFLVIAIFSLIWVNGLSYNKATGSFEQTSVVAVESKIKNVSVFLNNEFISESLPTQQRNLKSGKYEFRVERKNYQTLKKIFRLDIGQVEIIGDLVMVAKKPLVTSLDSDYRFVDVGDFSTGITLIDGKLYDGTAFVTRFSTDPEKVYRLNFTYIYVVNNEIRVFVPETNQDFLLGTTVEDEVVINTKSFSWSFAVLDGDNRYLLNIAESSEQSEDSSL